MNAHQIVEAVLFAADAPLTASEIARADEMLDEDQVEEALQFLRAEYDDAGRSFQIVEVAEGHQILTRPEFAPYLERFDNVPRSSRLSGPALETLAIIAYRQPIGRLEIEYVRGVGAAGVIRTLQERQLIDVVGRSEGLGRPLLYGTTQHFLEHFGFRSIEDLPRPEELPVVLRERIPLGPEELEEGGEEAAETGESVEGDAGGLAADAAEEDVRAEANADEAEPDADEAERGVDEAAYATDDAEYDAEESGPPAGASDRLDEELPESEDHRDLEDVGELDDLDAVEEPEREPAAGSADLPARD